MDEIERLCLKDIQITAFNSINQVNICNLPLNAPWIFITGENGTGKTIFLQAISSGLYPIHDQINDTQNIIGPNGRVKINVHGQGNFGIYRIGTGSLKIIDNKNFSFLSCYGPSRLQTLNESNQNERVGFDSGISRLFGAHTFLKNIDFELIKWELKSNSIQLDESERAEFSKKLEFTKKLFIEMLELEDIEVDIKNDIVTYFEKGSDGLKLNGVRCFQLGAGYRNLLGFVGDMILNLSSNQKKINDPSQLWGIVIIDELELHLHPIWQKALPGILSRYFPKIQFITSTHSPIPLLGAPSGSVFLKVDRTLNEGLLITRLEKLEKDIKFLQPNAVFTSDVFDFENISSTQANDFTNTRHEDRYDDILINDEIKDKLNKLSNSEVFPEDLFVNK